MSIGIGVSEDGAGRVGLLFYRKYLSKVYGIFTYLCKGERKGVLPSYVSGDFGLHVSKESIIEYIFLWNDISRRDLLS